MIRAFRTTDFDFNDEPVKLHRYFQKNEQQMKLTDRTILNFVLLLIVFKPIFDLDWKYPLFHVEHFAVPFHQIVAFIVPVIITGIIIARLFLNAPIPINNNVFAFIFLFSATVTLFLQGDIYSIGEYIRSYNFFFIFLSVPLLFNSTQKFYRIAKLAILISIIPTFLSYLQTFGFLSFTYWDSLPNIGRIGRISGGYHHPTGYLNYLLFLIPLAIHLYTNKMMSKKIFWFWILFTLPMVVRSLHRATIILVLFQIFMFVFFLRKIWLKYFIIFSSVIVLFLSFPTIWRFINVGEAISGYKFRGRSKIWQIYVSSFKESTFSQKIFGFGSPKLIVDNKKLYEPHSDWLRIMFNYGYFGFICYILFLASTFWISFVTLVRLKRKFRIQSEALLGLILVLTIVLYSITMEPLRYSNFSWGCAFVLGYAYMKVMKQKYSDFMRIKAEKN